MKSLFTSIIRLRNPAFAFSDDIDSRMIISFLLATAALLLRGLKVLLRGKLPKGLMLGRNVSFRHLHKISFGRLVKLGDQVRLQALGREGIRLGNNVSIGDYSRVIVSTTLGNIGRYIRIGDNVGIGEHAYLGGAGGLSIGDDCIIGQYFSCHPENHNFDALEPLIRHQGVSRSGIRLGKDCWVGAKVTILDGVNIGDHCVIAAGAVVTRSFPAYSVIGGVPAKLLKERATTFPSGNDDAPVTPLILAS
ncbi:acyltransferase [Neolewinella aurantiaca]|uniref:Acyltransferase n=1 Tax=Neolewinella aurantiaca TaxID=2602767 RepID=A0A5C7FKS5_9BACT|nr:acyltransferase [Neolewinella aurantiaca]TXF85966.1 acyltransferase [Neolewinella aurantiaca]